jgi:hypothetical protein
MDVISADMPFDNRDFAAHTDLPQNLPGSLRYLAPQHFVPLLGCPHQVILNIVCGPFLYSGIVPSFAGTIPHLAEAVRLLHINNLIR